MKRICNMILNITVKKQKGDQAESRIKITHHTKTIRQKHGKKTSKCSFAVTVEHII